MEGNWTSTPCSSIYKLTDNATVTATETLLNGARAKRSINAATINIDKNAQLNVSG